MKNRECQRRSRHGIDCRYCGAQADQVRVVNTRTRRYPAHMAERTRVVRRECHCQHCGAQWWIESKVVETFRNPVKKRG